MITDIELIKKHLQIDEEFIQDDDYLASLAMAAEDAVCKHLNLTSLDDLKIDSGEMPASVCHAILLLIANLYNSREPITDKTVVKVPYSYEYLLSLYRKY